MYEKTAVKKGGWKISVRESVWKNCCVENCWEKKIVEENVLKNSLGKYVCNIRCRNMEPLCHAPCMFPQVSRSLRETKNH